MMTPSSAPPETHSADRSLLVTRIVWVALILGQVLFLGVVVALQAMGSLKPIDADTLQTLFLVNLVLLAGVVPIAYVIRMQMYKRNWQGDAVTPNGYFQGNLIFFALLEGQSLFSIVITMLAGEIGVTLIPAAIALAIQAINMPNGRPMQSPHDEPRFGEDLERPTR